MNETASRSLVKTVSYRILGSSITFIISFMFTGEVIISAGISATEFLLKPTMYWLHERVWNRISWGKNKV
jgi:uncharacterized membrane protein